MPPLRSAGSGGYVAPPATAPATAPPATTYAGPPPDQGYAAQTAAAPPATAPPAYASGPYGPPPSQGQVAQYQGSGTADAPPATHPPSFGPPPQPAYDPLSSAYLSVHDPWYAHWLRVQQRAQAQAQPPSGLSQTPLMAVLRSGQPRVEPGASPYRYGVYGQAAADQAWGATRGYDAVERARAAYGTTPPPPWDVLRPLVQAGQAADQYVWPAQVLDQVVGDTLGSWLPPALSPRPAVRPPAPALAELNARNTGGSAVMPGQPLPVPTWDTTSGYGSVEASRAGAPRTRPA